MKKLFGAKSSSSPTLGNGTLIAATFGKTNITPILRYILQGDGKEMKYPSSLSSNLFYDDLQTATKALVLVVRDRERDRLWFEIVPGNHQKISSDLKIFTALKEYTCKNHGIQVVFAVYGLKECTRQVGEIFENQRGTELSVHASNSVFGDPWPNVFKSFTLVYRVKLENGQFSEPRVKVVEEHVHLTINLAEELKIEDDTIEIGPNSISPFIKKLRHDRSIKEVYKNVPTHDGINILAATYGPADVTDKVKEYLNAERTYLRINATNEVFGDTWGGVVKYLVVFYKIDKDEEIYVACEKEGQTMTISKHNTDHVLTATPRMNSCNLESNHDILKIHGAMVGFNNTTETMKEYLENNEGAEKTISVSEVGWYEQRKCLVMLYSLGDGPFTLFTLRQEEQKSLFETKSVLSSLYIANNRERLLKLDHHDSTYKGNTINSKIYINYRDNEIMVAHGMETSPSAVFLLKWKEGEQILKNHLHQSSIASSAELIKTMIEDGTRIQIRGPLMTIKNGQKQFQLPLFEVTNMDLRKKILPKFVRNNLVTYLDDTMPDQPGLVKFTSLTLFALTDVTIHFN